MHIHPDMQGGGEQNFDTLIYMSLWHINCLKLVKVVLLVKNSTANAGCRFDPWVGKIFWRGIWQPTPVSVPGKNPMERGAWRAGYHPWGRKEWERADRLSTFSKKQQTRGKALKIK